MARTKLQREYVSPVERAKSILAACAPSANGECSPTPVRGTKKPSPALVRAAKRVLALASRPREDLLAEEAPWSVFRWVAWGSRPEDRKRRAELCIHLRRSLDTAWGGWIRNSQLQAAFKTWQRRIDAAVKAGRIQPHAEDLPLSEYERVIDGASGRLSGRSSPKTHDAPQPVALQITSEHFGVLTALSDLLKKTG